MAQIKPTVQLRIYKGSEKTFKVKNGENVCINENQKVTLTYDTLEWKNYFKYIGASGFGIIEVEKCFDNEGNEVDIPKEVADFVANVFVTPEAELTPDQKRIADLEAKIEALTKASKPAKEEKQAKEPTK